MPILGYVSERLWLMIRVLSYDYSGLSLTDVIKCCGTSVQPLQSVKPIRIAVSTVTDDWKGHTDPLSELALQRIDVFER